MESYVESDIRDEIIKQCLTNKDNCICFDCGSRNPKWASVYLGLFICLECSGRHRSYGTSITFVRSIDLDKWKRHQLEGMLLGGNTRAKQAFKEMNIDYEDKHINYYNEKIIKYKENLADLVKILLQQKIGFKNEDKEVKVEKIEQNIEKKEVEVKESKVVDLGENTNASGKMKTNNKKKKIEKCDDFDWDADDFKPGNFNKVEVTTTKATKQINYDSDEEREKVVEAKSKPIDSSPPTQEKKIDTSSLKNKKAISSEDYENFSQEAEWKKKEKDSKLKQMKNYTAISSAELNGEIPEEGKILF